MEKLASYDKGKKQVPGGSHEEPESDHKPETVETESEDGGVRIRAVDREGGYMPPEPVCMDGEDSE